MLRFLQKSCPVKSDGWYIDDIQLKMKKIDENEIISFTANLKDKFQVLLEWSTSVEKDNRGFSVEKSSDAVNWKEIAFIPSMGNSTRNSLYSTLDNNYLPGKTWYRINQINTTGTKTSYSPIVVYTDKLTGYSLAQNYPNPFNSTTVINYQLPTEGKVRIEVFDILGNSISELVNEIKTAGAYSTEFSSGRIPSGIYFYRILINGFVETKKLVVIK